MENYVYSDDHMVLLSSKSKDNFMSYNFDHDFKEMRIDNGDDKIMLEV